MAAKNTNPFVNLSWDDLQEWAGEKIVSRGVSYHRQKLVSQLAVFDNGDLLASVEGSRLYATKVTVGANGLPQSRCSCPYSYDCKHGVAVVLEYLEQIQNKTNIPQVAKDDKRLSLFSGYIDDLYLEQDDDGNISGLTNKETKLINAFLKDKTKQQITELLIELANKFPAIAQDIIDRQQLSSGDVNSLINRLRENIRDITDEPAWQNHWDDEGHIPDYSKIRVKLEALLEAGYPDDVLDLGKELIELGSRQVELSNDDGATSIELSNCMPVVVKALEQSSLSITDRLIFAIDVVLEDNYDVFNDFFVYIRGNHTKSQWSDVADKLLIRLEQLKPSSAERDFSRDYKRDRLTDMIIYAFEQSGRKSEIVPLCEAEVRHTLSYPRLVKYLIKQKRYKEAEKWITEGINETENRLPGIASDLRRSLKEIRSLQKDWITVATMQAEEFVQHPSTRTYKECKKANVKTKSWEKVREHLLVYLKNGELPWKQKGWPLAVPAKSKPCRGSFPMAWVLIDIAILEKQPEQVLFWHDYLLKNVRNSISESDDTIAASIQEYAPERAIEIWKAIAEGLINQTKPSAYQQSMRYLRKAKSLMKKQDRMKEWEKFLIGLRQRHSRKIRFIEILNRSNGKPIISEDK